jgi:hypothetical protein
MIDVVEETDRAGVPGAELKPRYLAGIAEDGRVA